MEIKDLLTGSEKSLPTIDQAASTSTTVSMPVITASPQTYFKTGLSVVVGTAGMCYLMYGKKAGDLRKMIIGAVLTLLSIFIY